MGDVEADEDRDAAEVVAKLDASEAVAVADVIGTDVLENDDAEIRELLPVKLDRMLDVELSIGCWMVELVELSPGCGVMELVELSTGSVVGGGFVVSAFVVEKKVPEVMEE